MRMLNPSCRAILAPLAPAVVAARQASATPIGRRYRLSTAGPLTAMALLLFSCSALAFEGEVIDDTFTGCVRGNGQVRNLQRGDEPRRTCGRYEQQARFAQTPLGIDDSRPSDLLEVRAVSWNVRLGLGEEFSPAPGIEMRCEFVGDAFVELNVDINGELFARPSSGTLGRDVPFLYQGNVSSNQLWGGESFLIRAGGIASTDSADSEPLPCSSQGFAEFFEGP